MTTQLPSKERLERVIQLNDIYDPELTKALARFALAAHEQEPVMYTVTFEGQIEEIGGDCQSFKREDCQSYIEWLCDEDNQAGYAVTPLYTHPAPVPAVSMPDGLHPDTQKLVSDFSAALAEKLYKAQLKYGYSANWKNDDWQEECLKHFHQHIGKGDPRDVAAYCAFMWHHGWKTESQAPVPAVPDAVSKLLNILDRHTVELGWCEPPISLAELVIARDGQEELDAIRAMLNGGKS
ncbi:hypothetical protein ACRARH_03845 [Phytobacter ursingii]